MKPKAALFNLWEKHYAVIKAFAEGNPDYLIAVPYGGFVALPSFASFAGRIVPYENALTRPEAEAVALAAAPKAQFLGALPEGPCQPAWDAFCSNLGVSPEKAAASLFREVGPKLLDQMLQVETLEKLRDKLDIRVVVVNEEYTLLPKSLVVWAKAQGIPVLHINHSLGMCGWYTVNDTMLSDALAVYGPIVADGPMEIAISGNRIFVSGNPDWIPYAECAPHKAEFRRQAAERYFGGREAPLVVFGTTFSAQLTATEDGKDHTASARDFFRAMARLKATGFLIHCVVKLRPNNDLAFEQGYAAIAAEEGLRPGDCLFLRNDLERLILAADALVSVDSTLSADALLADTLAINLITEEGWRRGPYYPRHTGILECRAEDLAECLRLALTDPVLQGKLREMRRRSLSAFQGVEPGSNPCATLARLIARMATRSLPAPGEDSQADTGGAAPWAQVAGVLSRAASRKKLTLVIRPTRDIRALADMLPALVTDPKVATEIVCLLPNGFHAEAKPRLPENTHLLEIGDDPHAKPVLAALARAIPGGFVAFLDPGIRLGKAWESRLIHHLMDNAAVAPLSDGIAGTQSIYHYLPMERLGSLGVEALSQEARRRFPGMALATDWVDDQALVFGPEVLAAIAGLPDEDPPDHFLGLGQKLRLAGAKLLVAKDVFAGKGG